ncbi:MAG: Rpn family recombination-promoting nuclease/putative transposase [Tannerellaceae bacterium]|jgi:predicted transposase/invertase (TIGR01784 family)|nr:Rpn family recombination-promoting nuclease/putative transposase [Tannerellaceae bacterium]
MARYLDPKNDLPFKRIFGEHPDLLKSFLNALMPLEKDQQIVNLEYLAAEQVPDNPAKKNSIVDVRCKDNYGRQFIVEMQMYWNNVFSNRMVFNASKAYVRQLDKNEYYHLLQPVYALAILNDVFDEKTPEFYHHYRIVNYRNTDEVIRGLEFVMVELPKFSPEKWADRRMAVLWLRFLKEVKESKPVVSADLKENADIRKALDICEEGAFTEAELATYDKYWDIIRTENSLIAASRAEGMAEGLTEGRAEGLAEGRAEGLAEGEAKGIAKGIAEIVINCKRNGFSIEQIKTITGLSEERILEILHHEEP